MKERSNPTKPELTKSSISSLLLQLIAQQPMYGYQIIKELKSASEGYFAFKEGTLYPVLHRLESAGLIMSKWQALPNSRQRKYYYLTAKGSWVLEEKRDQWRDFVAAMNLIIKPQKA